MGEHYSLRNIFISIGADRFESINFTASGGRIHGLSFRPDGRSVYIYSIKYIFIKGIK